MKEVEAKTSAAAAQPNVRRLPALPPPQQVMGPPSPLFRSPMPAGATSSYDQFERQFYGRTSLPTQRLFPTGVD